MALRNRGIIRNRLLATVAFSALLSGTALAQSVPYNWAGPYAGLNLGYIGGWTQTHETDGLFGSTPIFGALSSHGSSLVGGGQVGYNWQFGSIVLGAEADFEGTGLHYSANNGVTSGFPGAFSTETKLSQLGTIRGRFGYAFAPIPLLVFGTAGIAYGDLTDSVAAPNLFGSRGASITGWRAGWVAGGGFEYAIDTHWTVRAEGLYVDFGGVNFAFDNGNDGTYRFSARDRAVIGRGAINYKF